MFSEKDILQIKNHQLTKELVEEQIQNFINDFPPSELIKPAVVDDGIMKLTEDQVQAAIKDYESKSKSLEILKFVPASGAASRMFKKLFAFHSEYDGSDEAYKKLTSDQSAGTVFEFFKRLEDFAFYKDLKDSFENDADDKLEESHLQKEYVKILDSFLLEKGLNYGSLPKGLLKFHEYGESQRTPIEEHIVEGCQYAKSGENVKIHFTVSPEHLDLFKSHVEDVRANYESQFDCKLDISYSTQKPSTDTIAVDLENKPFKNADDTLLFRPAGHGALLANLNDIDADVIFLKNIDNVVPDHLKPETITYKQVIAGIMLQVQEEIFSWIAKIESGGDTSGVQGFVEKKLGFKLDDNASNDEILSVLNRPIRVCGMVKNEGEPGGGPFWVKDSQGNISLQIVESAQIDTSKEDQKSIMQSSTHFNPVDVVCAVKNNKGEKFDLLQYRDPSTGFNTEKSKDGKSLKAQELPGLWNGSMAYWNTIFVEVPLITFNPVKTVNDLLRKEHQPG